MGSRSFKVRAAVIFDCIAGVSSKLVVRTCKDASHAPIKHQIVSSGAGRGS